MANFFASGYSPSAKDRVVGPVMPTEVAAESALLVAHPDVVRHSIEVAAQDHDVCGYCGADNGAVVAGACRGEYRVGFDCCKCGSN